jgi:hypothetical protein
VHLLNILHLKRLTGIRRSWTPVILFAAGLCIPGPATAQLPSFGIYRLKKTTDNILPADYYARYIVNPGLFYEVDLIPDQEITGYGLSYALVSVDTVTRVMKIALLRDTVSEEGKRKFHARRTGISYNSDWQPVFSQQFVILGDSVSAPDQVDERFPSRPDLEGHWVFDNPTYRYLDNYGNILAFVGGPPLRSQLVRYDSIGKRRLYGSRFVFGESFFSPYLNQPPYRDLIFTFDHDSIPFYKTPALRLKPSGYFRKASYIAVRGDSAGWLEVDQVNITGDPQIYFLPGYGAVKGTTKLDTRRGWLRKEDLVENPWTRQTAETRDFRFEVAGSYNEDDDPTVPGEVEALKIINKKKNTTQLIYPVGTPLADSLDDVVGVEDCNFDGYPDIMIYGHNGGAGPNDGYNFYLYDPRTGGFRFNEALSDLTQVEVDTGNKTITSAWRDGAGHHGGEQYTFLADTLTKISYWDDYQGNGYFAQYSFGSLMDGKWCDSSFYQTRITAKETPVFPAPGDTQRLTGTLRENDPVSIRETKPLWALVRGEDTAGVLIKGWIPVRTMLPVTRISFSASTPAYAFSAAAPDSFSVAAIQVTRKSTNQPVQYILIYQPSDFRDSMLQTGDYNGDGALDFRIETTGDDGGASWDYYLFDEGKGLFTREENTGPAAR